MKASLLKNIRHPESEKRTGKINYKIVTFIVCLFMSVFLWLMNTLSKKYTEAIDFRVQYQHLPQDKKLYPSSESVSVKVTSSGFGIVAYTLGLKEPLLNIDASQFRHRDNRYIYLLNGKTHIEKIEEQLSDQIKVIDITPDTLFLNTTQTQD